MMLFDLSLNIKGFPIYKASKKLDNIKALSKSQFTEYQEESKWEIFHHHFKNNEYYKTWVNKTGLDFPQSWSDIPILTKQDLQVPVEKRLALGYSKKNVHLHNTSGSSGTPFFFAKDKFCHAMTWAIIKDRYAQHGIKYGNSLQARFYGIPLSKIKYYLEVVKDTISARERFPVFDLSSAVLDKYIERFKSGSFVYINGYTSSLVLFAKHVLSRGLVLKDVCPTLQLTIPTSEMCSKEDRELMIIAFGVPVVNEYGAAELDIIAFEDKDLDWVISDETLFVEVVDDSGKPVELGSPGRLLITSLYNKAMPFIRYEVGDIGVISTKRKGNHQILESLVGRTNDIATLPSGKQSPGLTFYYITKSLLENGGGVKEFIIKQLTLNHFHFEYVADNELSLSEKSKIQSAMDLYLEKGLKSSFEKKKRIDRTKAGKLKQFQNLVK